MDDIYRIGDRVERMMIQFVGDRLDPARPDDTVRIQHVWKPATVSSVRPEGLLLDYGDSREMVRRGDIRRAPVHHYRSAAPVHHQP